MEEKRITIISERDFFTFIPMIHEVATGTLLPFSITQSIRSLPPCCLHQFIEARVGRIDADGRKISIHHINPEAPSPGNGIRDVSEEEIPFDYCILALGSEMNYFNIPGAREHTLALNTLEDARHVKNRIIESFEQAQITKNEAEKRRLLRFVIVGGGPTGVELAGELADLLNGELRKFFPMLYPYAEIRLYEARERFMCSADEWFGERAFQILSEKKRVRVFCGTPLLEVSKEGVRLGNGFLPAGTVLWTAGVQARTVHIMSKKQIVKDKKTRRIKVNNQLQIRAYPRIFVAGDQAWIEEKEAGQPYPMRAQFAVEEGGVAAENIMRLMMHKPLKDFFWHDKGLLVSIGKGTALAEVFGVQFSGMIAWVIYRTAYLLKIVGLRAKFRTALEWILNTFLPRDISKL